LKTPNVASLKIIFGNHWWEKLFQRGYYNVIDTDYDNYTVVYVNL